MTHFFAAAVASIAIAGAVFLGDTQSIAAGSVLAIATAVTVGLLSARRLNRALKAIDSVVSDYQQSEKLQTGLREVDQLAGRLAKCAQQWESIAAATRDQASEFQAIMVRLDRRGFERRVNAVPSGQHLRSALTGLGHNLHEHLVQIEKGAEETEQFSRFITEGAESQGHAVIKTTTYLEQLSATIDAVSSNAASAQTVLQTTGNSARTALQLLKQLNQGMRRVQAETQSCEKKLQGLSDPARQINAIVNTISDIAARTNLLALNASIESMRAGEHGRGFALVADEVRNLAEQATVATREISSLMDSMQMATQESIRGIVREREQVEVEVERAANAEQTLRQMTEQGKDLRAIEMIVESSAQQLLLAQDVVLAVEQISSLAKANRGKAESIGWTMKTLTNVNPELRKVIDRLRDNTGEETAGDKAASGKPVLMTSSATAADFATVG